MPADPPVPAEAFDAAIEDFFLFAEPPYARFDELVKARLTVALRYVAADLVAAGRKQAADAIRRTHDTWSQLGKLPQSYLDGVADAAGIADEHAERSDADG